MTLLAIFVGSAVGVSFLCSLLEAVLLSSRASNLSAMRAAGNRGASLLLEIKQSRLDDAISAILILNTVANTLGATMAGAQAGVLFGSVWVGAFSAALALLILIVSEIIPKTLGAVYAKRLGPLVGWTLHGLTLGMAPVLVLSRQLTRLLTRGGREGMSRGELAAVITTATREGALSDDESRLLDNLLRFNEVRVQDVMTPRTVIFMMPVESNIQQMLEQPESEPFSRIPLYNRERDNVVGYVLQRDVLRAVARNCGRAEPLRRFMRPISFIPELATLGQALSQILQRREHIAMVTDEHGGVEGLVTLEDLTETMLGVEIVDESDRVVDMRQVAIRRRDQRLERLRREQGLDRPAGEAPG